MALSKYIRLNFANGATPAINASNLSHIEDGIELANKETHGLFSSTPGAVTTVNIPHTLGVTPTYVSVRAASVNARGASSFYLSTDDTNLTINFSSALTAATVYDFWWVARV